MGNVIPEEYWDSQQGRYDSHRYFNTVNHHHISDYSSEVTCDIMIVECSDGRWFIEDNWGNDAKGAKDVFNPTVKGSYPIFFPDMGAANLRAAEIVSAITGASIEELLLDNDEENE